MSKRRIRFSKTGMGKYISHLDLLRTFTRAIQRSGLPVVYTQGFNPHQKITFSLPLPIGVTSECECVDIEFEDIVSDDEIMQKMNENLPMDMRVLGVGDLMHKASHIISAEYVIELLSEPPVGDMIFQSFFGESEILVTKKTKKKGEKQVNLLDFVRAWEVLARDENSVKLRIVLAAGNDATLKPELLVGALEAYISPNLFEGYHIHRVQIFCQTEEDPGKAEVFE